MAPRLVTKHQWVTYFSKTWHNVTHLINYTRYLVWTLTWFPAKSIFYCVFGVVSCSQLDHVNIYTALHINIHLTLIRSTPPQKKNESPVLNGLNVPPGHILCIHCYSNSHKTLVREKIYWEILCGWLATSFPRKARVSRFWQSLTAVCRTQHFHTPHEERTSALHFVVACWSYGGPAREMHTLIRGLMFGSFCVPQTLTISPGALTSKSVCNTLLSKRRRPR